MINRILVLLRRAARLVSPTVPAETVTGPKNRALGRFRKVELALPHLMPWPIAGPTSGAELGHEL